MRFLKIAAAALLAFAASGAQAQGVSGTLLVGNKGEDTVSFVDLATGTELGRAATGRMPHEIAISPDGAQAAVVSYGARSIDIFDVASRTRLRTVDLSPHEGPHGLVWLADGRIVATTERSQSVVIVDTRNRDQVRSIRTDQAGTHMVAVAPDGERAFTANIPAGTVTEINLRDVAKVRDIAVGGRPEGITLTDGGRVLWVGDLEGGRVQAFDTRTQRRLAQVRTGPVPIRVLASPDGRWVVTSNYGNGSVSVIDARRRRLVRTISVSGQQQAAQVTILFSADGRRLYVAETGRNQVAEVEFASGRVLRRLPAGRQGDGLAIAP